MIFCLRCGTWKREYKNLRFPVRGIVTVFQCLTIRRTAQHVTAVVLTALLFPVGPVLAGDELDDILSGFDGQQQPAAAGFSDDLDDALSGFDEVQTNDEGETDADQKLFPEWLELFGSLSLAGSWNYAHDAPAPGEADFRGLSMLRSTGALGGDIDLGAWRARFSGHVFYDAAYSIQGRDQYSDRFLEEYEQELEIDELYLAGSLSSSLDLKIGRQVVVWGKADNLRVTDILNPLDNRIPGMVDIKYKRLPVAMTKFDYYSGPWNLSAIVINEVRFDKTPVFNSDFFPGDTPLPPEREPTSFALDSQQYGLALNGIFSGWDLSLYQAWVYDNRAHLTMDSGTPLLVHSRVSMTGLSANVAFGNWLLKGEAAWWQDLEFATLPEQDFERLEFMAGIEYTGFSETILSLEFVNRHLLDFDERLGLSPDFARQDQQQTALMFSRDFVNDTIQLKILCSIFGFHGEDGAFERFQLKYDLNDYVTLTGGVIFYQSGDQVAFSEVADNDRLFFEYSYAF
jgi:Protein of unknown function (DUF1302)